jgi:hypothetical protein
MRRREFLKLSAAVAGSGMLAGVLGQTTQSQAVTLSVGPHLFLDDYFIESQQNLSRVTQSPKRLTEPVITGREHKNYQKTPTKPFPADGTVHAWSLKYDPDAAAGNGQITFVLDDKTYTRALSPGHKSDGATFDRFGILGVGTAGNVMQAYFADLGRE